jgi:hypothetical protein
MSSIGGLWLVVYKLAPKRVSRNMKAPANPGQSSEEVSDKAMAMYLSAIEWDALNLVSQGASRKHERGQNKGLGLGQR